MMNVKNFIESSDYKEFKKVMLDEFKTRPLEIKSESTASIALEVKACQKAIDKLERAFKRFESLAKPELIEKETYV